MYINIYIEINRKCNNIRGSVAEELEGRKEVEKALRDELEVAVPHVVHEVYVDYISGERRYGCRFR